MTKVKFLLESKPEFFLFGPKLRIFEIDKKINIFYPGGAKVIILLVQKNEEEERNSIRRIFWNHGHSERAHQIQFGLKF